MTHILIPKIKEVQVRQDGTRVQMIVDGREILSLPWDAALALAQAIVIQAKRGEEIVRADQIVGDQALLTRLGASFGLTSNPVLLKRAMNEAAWNSTLRQHIPIGRAGGLESQAVFGAPTLRQEPPRKVIDGD